MADHPLKVPQDLAERLWLESADKPPQCNTFRAHVFAQKIAQWAADAQLMKVNDWIRCLQHGPITGIRSELDVCQLERIGSELYAALRPKPPSLKEQALQLLETYNTPGVMLTADQADTIRRALEALPDE